MSLVDVIEKEIQEKGLTAPRVTPEHIESVIVSEDYHVFPGSTTTVCMLGLRNGFTVVGKSACASAENFDEELGRKLAYRDAHTQIGHLEGYLLRQQLYEKESTHD